jgi:hypothetical protein
VPVQCQFSARLEVLVQCKVGGVSSALGSSLQGGRCQISARWEVLVQRSVYSSLQGGRC